MIQGLKINRWTGILEADLHTQVFNGGPASLLAEFS